MGERQDVRDADVMGERQDVRDADVMGCARVSSSIGVAGD
jgi:hypothetical protein